MTSVKRNFGSASGHSLLIILISLVLCMGGWLIYTHFFQQQSTLLAGVLGRLQEKIPHHDAIIRQARKTKFPAYTLYTTTASSFTIDPGLIDTQWSDKNTLLSGNMVIESERKTKQGQKGNSLLGISLSGSVAGIVDNVQEVLISLEASMSARYIDTSWYLRLNNIHLYSTGKEMESVVLRNLLLHRFEDTRIRMDAADVRFLNIFSPLISQEVLEKNTQKIRLLSTDNGRGTLYSVSGSSLLFSGSRNTLTDHMTHIVLPDHDIATSITSTHIPHTHNITLQQKNAYAGIFNGVMTYLFKRKYLEQRIFGEVLFPGGVWSSLEHTRVVTPTPISNIASEKVPEKFIERGQLKKQRSDEKKQDSTLN